MKIPEGTHISQGGATKVNFHVEDVEAVGEVRLPTRFIPVMMGACGLHLSRDMMRLLKGTYQRQAIGSWAKLHLSGKCIPQTTISWNEVTVFWRRYSFVSIYGTEGHTRENEAIEVKGHACFRRIFV